ncbi:MAG: hypothetical protein AAGB11_14840 [Pseudomonadota bacterium]
MNAPQYTTYALMEEIRDFCDAFGIAQSTFGRHAVNDGKFVSRIEQGSWITQETAERVHAFMASARNGQILLRGRPRRKKSEARAQKMEELISRETSVRTAGSFAYLEQRQRLHVFSNTTNEHWVLADRAAEDMAGIAPSADGFRILYAPMDNGIALTRLLRAQTARHPDMPILVVMKGRGLEDLRNTIGRLVDRLAEHPNIVFVVTNMYLDEAVDLTKRSDDNPADPIWHDGALEGSHSYDFQRQVSALFGELSKEWLVESGDQGQPVYAAPSVAVIYRKDAKPAIEGLIPHPGDPALRYNYALLNHPYLHTHTMAFRTEFVLGPVAECLAVGGRMMVVQSLGEDPAHELVKRVWPDQPMHTTSRHDIISAMRKRLSQQDFSFSGLTDTNALFRFDMHTLPVGPKRTLGALSLNSAWNNAVYYAQVREDLAQEAMRAGAGYLNATRDVIEDNGGLWFINEAFTITRTGGD